MGIAIGGYRAIAAHIGSMVLSGDTTTRVVSTGTRQLTLGFPGGIKLGATTTLTGPANSIPDSMLAHHDTLLVGTQTGFGRGDSAVTCSLAVAVTASGTRMEMIGFSAINAGSAGDSSLTFTWGATFAGSYQWELRDTLGQPLAATYAHTVAAGSITFHKTGPPMPKGIWIRASGVH
jgi:hypothetical protein